MAWDSSRPVPWQRLIREWLIYMALATAALVIYTLASDNSFDVALFAGLFASGPMYLLFGAVLAKFGYQRKTYRELRGERAVSPRRGRGEPATTAATAASRPKPPPTKRTSTGPSQHHKPKRR